MRKTPLYHRVTRRRYGPSEMVEINLELLPLTASLAALEVLWDVEPDQLVGYNYNVAFV